MRAPRLVGCYFATRPQTAEPWSRMARVLAHTAARQCPGWDVSIERLPGALPPSRHRSEAEATNTLKLDHWAAAVADAPDGARLALVDVDTAVLRGLDDAWSLPFDLAYTVREVSRLPLNAGVVFVRVSSRTRALVAAWRGENRRMFADARYHEPWQRRFGGMNQAAFGKVLESGLVGELGLELARLPCREWNCEDSSWRRFDPERTRILHLKSGLRRTIFGIGPSVPWLQDLARLWRALEREAAEGA